MRIVALLFSTLATAQYVLESKFSGSSFLDNFDFYTSWDPTFGYVHYVDQATAKQYGMINISTTGGPTIFGADDTQVLDPEADLGRLSLRLTSKQSWTHGLFIADIAHMPGSACGLWPAFWTLGVGDLPWPNYGEVDIIEYLNLAKDNLMALHTSEGCDIAGSDQSGRMLSNECGKDGGIAGCYSTPNEPNSAGTGFNANGGGVYAMQWTSEAIKIWFFPRGQLPASIAEPLPPDISTFGVPTATFAGGCDIDRHFFNHSLIFNIEFCGSWAGPTFVDDGCPALDPTNQWHSCNMYVAANPQAYDEAYWAVNYIEVYTSATSSPPATSSSLSSQVPAQSTTSVTVSGAEGRTTTPTQSLWPPNSWSTKTGVKSSFTPSPTLQSFDKKIAVMVTKVVNAQSITTPEARAAESLSKHFPTVSIDRSVSTESFDPKLPGETRIPASWTFECCFEYVPLTTESPRMTATASMIAQSRETLKPPVPLPHFVEPGEKPGASEARPSRLM